MRSTWRLCVADGRSASVWPAHHSPGSLHPTHPHAVLIPHPPRPLPNTGTSITGATVSDHAGVRRVHFIFDRGLRKFKGDLRFWLQYIDFAQRSQSTHALGRILAKYVVVPQPALLERIASGTCLLGRARALGARFLGPPFSKDLWRVLTSLSLSLSRQCPPIPPARRAPVDPRGVL